MITKDPAILCKMSYDIEPGSDISSLVNDMNKELVKAKGVGIAAIQIGVQKRVIIINTDKVKMVVVNPSLTDCWDVKNSKEGCLSVPFKKVKIKRFSKVTIHGFDMNGEPIMQKLRNLAAFVAQHEIDHLNGVTI